MKRSESLPPQATTPGSLTFIPDSTSSPQKQNSLIESILMPSSPGPNHHSLTSIKQIPQNPISPYSNYILDKHGVSLSKAIQTLSGVNDALNAEYDYDINCLQLSFEMAKDFSKLLRDNKYYGIDLLRENGKYYICYLMYTREYYEHEIQRLKNNLDKISEFQKFLSTLPSTKRVDDLNFFNQVLIRQPDKILFQKRAEFLRKKQQLVLPNPDKNDQYQFFNHPLNKSGQILERMRCNISSLTYPDIIIIQEALSEFAPSDFVQDFIFDLLWSYHPYPLSDFKADPLPDVLDVVVAAFDPPFLPKRWQFFTLNDLNQSRWPLKCVVDMMFDLLLICNPFLIAKKFWDIICLLTNQINNIQVDAGKIIDDIDVDFDQLFTLLLICVLCSGLTTITEPMLYSVSFAEYVENNPHISFAMSHMEGLYRHIIHMDFQKLRQKSQNILAQHRDELDIDPLGVAKHIN